MARALLAEQGRGSKVAPDVSGALEGACALLRLRLDPWIGADGTSRLLHRALTISAESHPALGLASVRAEPPHIIGLAHLLRLSPEVARDAAEGFLATLFDDLARLVSGAVAVRLMLPDDRDVWTTDDPPPGDLR